MRLLSCIIFLLISEASIFAQSPHGNLLKIDCSNCHESTNWKIIPKNIKFDHNTETSFKLTGQHVSVSCQSCHKSLVFSDVKIQCVSCHKDVHQNSVGTNCVQCHTTNTWVVFNIIQMHQNSRFPLIGVHLNVDCQSCHSGYANLYFPAQSVSCFSCHKQQYYATTSPNHVQANFSTDCQTCHSIANFTWGNTSFNHSFFPLVGGHNVQNCFTCHAPGSNFKGLTTDCYPCHKQNYITAKNPDHVAAKFPTTCQDCHNTTTFAQATFNHNTTGFPLTGAHASVSCQSCHTAGYTNTPTDCYSCHATDYANTTNPNHAAQGFSHDCSQCHSTTDWGGGAFDHAAVGFSLTGQHANLQCAQCHASGFTNTSTTCISCHLKDYSAATSPVNHTAAGLPQTCQDCHSIAAPFTTSSFNHATTGFTLTGAHTTTSCESCHNGRVSGTPADCYSCHATQYNNTTDPNHVSQGFSHDCSQCHTTTSFGDASFNHNNTGFPLTGVHTTVTCQACHNSNYTNLSPACYGCHQQDYAGTTNPAHQTSGFPTDCSQCHTTSGWTPSTFNHTTYFPLTGDHNISTCNTCHTTASNFVAFSCTATCHSQASTDSHHSGVSGYVYSSASCYGCHPTGGGD